MKTLTLILSLSLLILSGCGSTPSSQKTPTPFQVTDQRVELIGCEDLKKRVREWNESNPNKEPKVADC